MAAVTLLLLAAPAAGEDSHRTRAYLHLHFAESNPFSNAHDAIGAAIGVNLGRYVGIELSLDSYEVFLDAPQGGKVAELSVLPIAPQIRFRYPFLDDRLVPYVVGGAGFGVTQVNDRSRPVAWAGGKTDVRPVGTVGGGIEWFFTDDIAFTLDLKYVIAGDGTYAVGRDETDVDLDAPILSFGLRLLYPELTPSSPQERADASAARFYLGARIGGTVLRNSHVVPGLRAEPEQPLFGSEASLLLGGALGIAAGRYVGLELSIEHHEAELHNAAGERVAEYSAFPILLQPRIRYPFLGGRLEPYALGGVGIELGEVNDRSAASDVSGGDQTFVAAMGAGFEYFVSGDVSIGCEVKYVFSRDHELRLDGRSMRADLDSLLFTVGIRAYLFDF